MSDRPLRRSLAFFLPAAVALTVACGLAFVGLQQALRSGANDPQIQLAEDVARGLDGGGDATTLIGTARVDVAASLAAFVVVYDAAGTALATTGLLDGVPPVPPIGVLDSARSSGIDKVTWQPRTGLRIAAVVVPWHGGTVLAGRSLRVVEERIGQIQTLAAIAWLAGLILLGAASVVAAAITRRTA